MKNFIFLFVLIISIIGCKSNRESITPDKGFSKYVDAFTSGVISVEAPVVVHLSQPVSEAKISGKKLFGFSPQVTGETVLVGDKIIEFRPSVPLNPDTEYKVEFMLGNLVKAESQFRKMKFGFSTIKQSLSVTFDGLKIYENIVSKKMKLTGYILTADVAESSIFEKILQADYEGRNIPVSWNHDPDRKIHHFSIDSLTRLPDKQSILEVNWNGSPLKTDNKGEKKFRIPGLNEFSIIDVKVNQKPGQHVEVVFSDPLEKGKNLEGLVSLEDGTNLRLAVDGNILKAWPSEMISGEKKLTVFPGFESAFNVRLKEQQTFILQFSGVMPTVKLIGKGAIVPQSKTLEIPFEAVSLRAVEVHVLQIYKNNILQFFQSNQFEDSNELKRVGRLIYSGVLDLSKQSVDLTRWNTFKVNLAELIKIEQGSIYRIEFRFKKEFSVYDCGDAKELKPLKELTEVVEPQYSDEWDFPDWYSDYYYSEDYDWNERDNPCSSSYYNSERFVSRNIFASELGIIAKEGKGHDMILIVSNLLSAKPESGVKLQLFNLQNQLITTVESDADGFAKFDLNKKPFLLIAQKNNQFGYLRLDDGNSLSTSSFDVSGEEITDGIKGYIYGERGVWRPGDTLFLNFIIEKQEVPLPADFPVLFQLINPSGQIVDRQFKNESLNGFYSYTTKTASDAPTGNWRVEVKAGNAYFTKRIKIETVKPNRLKIEVGLPKGVITSQTGAIPIYSEWLIGTPASSLKAKVDVLFVADKTEFKGYEKYSFTNPASDFAPVEQTIFDGKLNESGKANIPVDFRALDNAPGMVKAWFTTHVFEEGGDFSINVEQAKFAPFNHFVGLKMPDSEDNWYKTDTEYLPEIILIDANGKPVSGDDLEIKLYKIDWRWWWESGREYLAHYVSGSHYRPVATWNIPNAQNKNQIILNIKYTNWEDNGRYLLWVKNKSSEHAAGLSFYASKWGGWRAEGMSEGAALLSFSTDKEKYKTGEKIEVTIPSSKSGKALVSIENGSGVSDIFWVETKEKQTKFYIDAKPEMAPNFYLNVSMIQPYGQTENDAPIRMYGVIPVFVENPETILKPVINAPSEINPEKKYTIQVSEENRKSMTYSLAIVDEGLLGLTNYKTPDPHSVFYSREALGVKTWDLYDYVTGAYGSRLEKAFAVGGDEDLNASAKKEVTRFKPVVQYAGPFLLKEGKTNKHEFTMPNYIGAVRIMVVAGNNGAYGKAEKTVPVRTGLMLLATLPRVLAPDEEVVLPVNVFAMKDQVKNVNVTIKTNGLAEVSGESQKGITFSKTGDKMVWFKLKTGQKTGILKVDVEAESGNENANYTIELEIRNPNSAVTFEKSAFVGAKERFKGQISIPGEPGTGKAWIEVSGFPPLNLSKHLDYLISYPHGCIEQTVSSAFPQLFIQNLVEISAVQKQEMEVNVRAALQKIQSYQLVNGGFGYWPGAAFVNEWGTNFAGHFLMNAESSGYSLPVGLKKKWLDFQRSAARNWVPAGNGINKLENRNNDLTQAYRLYTLALAGSPDLGAMNRLREKGVRTAEVTWMLASAYVLAGQSEAAAKLVTNLSTVVDEYTEFSGTFGSPLRDKAIILESLILLDKRENAFKMLQEISAEISKTDWLSTQAAAWCLSSASKYASKYFKENESRFTVWLNKEKSSIRTKVPVVKLPFNKSNATDVLAEFENEGANPLFVKLMSRGIPQGLDTTSASKNLILSVKYLNGEGSEINPSIAKQGTEIKMAVTVKHPGQLVNYEEMVLSVIVPSGWEIINKRLNDIPQTRDAYFEYQNIRDDRIYTYFDLAVNQQKTFVFQLNAAYQGHFYQPPVRCEAMYDFSVYAQIPGRWVTVDKTN